MKLDHFDTKIELFIRLRKKYPQEMETGRANSWPDKSESKLVKDYVNDMQGHRDF